MFGSPKLKIKKIDAKEIKDSIEIITDGLKLKYWKIPELKAPNKKPKLIKAVNKGWSIVLVFSSTNPVMAVQVGKIIPNAIPVGREAIKNILLFDASPKIKGEIEKIRMPIIIVCVDPMMGIIFFPAIWLIIIWAIAKHMNRNPKVLSGKFNLFAKYGK